MKKKNLKILLTTIFTIIILAPIITIYVLKNNDNNNNNNANNKDTQKENYIAKSANDFIEHINKIDLTTNKTYQISYKNIVLNLNYNNDKPGYNLEIYYNNKKINYELNKEDYLTYPKQFYLFNDNKQNNAFVLFSEVGPAGSNSRYLIFIFNDSGEILFNETIVSDTITIDNNTINYKFETSMQEKMNLDIEEEKNENFCKYLKDNYEKEYIIDGTYKYEYKDNKLNLIKIEETTIKDYLDRNNCN